MDTEKNTAADMLHGANNANLRKQVCTFVFFFSSFFSFSFLFSGVHVGGAWGFSHLLT